MIQLPTTSVGTLRKFLTEHREMVFKYVVMEIEQGVKKNADHINLFQFGETRYMASIKKTQYIVALKEAMGFFVSKELYEEAGKCRDLIATIQTKEDQNSIEGFLQNF